MPRQIGRACRTTGQTIRLLARRFTHWAWCQVDVQLSDKLWRLSSLEALPLQEPASVHRSFMKRDGERSSSPGSMLV